RRHGDGRGGLVTLVVSAVQLQDALQLVDPDGAEPLGTVWAFQSHAVTVPPRQGRVAMPSQTAIPEKSGISLLRSGRPGPTGAGPARPSRAALPVRYRVIQLIMPRSSRPVTSIG